MSYLRTAITFRFLRLCEEDENEQIRGPRSDLVMPEDYFAAAF